MYNGTVEDCMETTLHHVAPHKAALMAVELGGFITEENLDAQHKRVFAEIQTALGQIRKIRAAATRGDLVEVMRLLDQRFDYGLPPNG